jgi:hypothetical protein
VELKGANGRHKKGGILLKTVGQRAGRSIPDVFLKLYAHLLDGTVDIEAPLVGHRLGPDRPLWRLLTSLSSENLSVNWQPGQQFSKLRYEDFPKLIRTFTLGLKQRMSQNK